MSQTNRTTLTWIKDYWFLIFFIGGMLVTWGVMTQRIQILETRTKLLEDKVEKNNNTLDELRGGIIRIETTLEFIKEKLDS